MFSPLFALLFCADPPVVCKQLILELPLGCLTSCTGPQWITPWGSVPGALSVLELR